MTNDPFPRLRRARQQVIAPLAGAFAKKPCICRLKSPKIVKTLKIWTF